MKWFFSSLWKFLIYFIWNLFYSKQTCKFFKIPTAIFPLIFIFNIFFFPFKLCLLDSFPYLILSFITFLNNIDKPKLYRVILLKKYHSQSCLYIEDLKCFSEAAFTLGTGDGDVNWEWKGNPRSQEMTMLFLTKKG